MSSIWDAFTPDEVENAGGSSIIGVGVHTVRVKEIKEDEPRNCTVVTFVDTDGSEIRDYFYATTAALWKIKAFGHAVHADKTKPVGSWFNARLSGYKLIITVVDDTYEGKTRKKVSKYESAPPVIQTPSEKPVETASQEYTDDIPF